MPEARPAKVQNPQLLSIVPTSALEVSFGVTVLAAEMAAGRKKHGVCARTFRMHRNKPLKTRSRRMVPFLN